jgi:hypothetical protein
VPTSHDREGKIEMLDVARVAQQQNLRLTVADFREVWGRMSPRGEDQLPFDSFFEGMMYLRVAARSVPAVLKFRRALLQVRKTPSWPRSWANFSLL